MRRKSLYFVPIINSLHQQHGFLSVIIYGAQGTGKTTYAIKTAAAIYGNYEEALRYLFFDLHNFVRTLREAFERGERIKIIILDDAALSLHRQQYRENVVTLFEKLYNLARTVATCFVFTTIHVSDLLRGLRNKFTYRVSMQRLSNNTALGKIYRFTLTPQLQPVVKLVGYQLVRLDLPPSFWRDYDVKRRAAVQQLFEQFERAITRRAEKRRKRVPSPNINSVAEAWGLSEILSG